MYSTAEYGALVWLNSSHTHKIDVQLNSVMRIITGTLNSTPLPWLPVLANIEPPFLRHEAACIREYKKCRLYENSLLFDVIQYIPIQRIQSRKPTWMYDNKLFVINQKWKGV